MKVLHLTSGLASCCAYLVMSRPMVASGPGGAWITLSSRRKCPAQPRYNPRTAVLTIHEPDAPSTGHRSVSILQELDVFTSGPAQSCPYTWSASHSRTHEDLRSTRADALSRPRREDGTTWGTRSARPGHDDCGGSQVSPCSR